MKLEYPYGVLVAASKSTAEVIVGPEVHSAELKLMRELELPDLR